MSGDFVAVLGRFLGAFVVGMAAHLLVSKWLTPYLYPSANIVTFTFAASFAARYSRRRPSKAKEALISAVLAAVSGIYIVAAEVYVRSTASPWQYYLIFAVLYFLVAMTCFYLDDKRRVGRGIALPQF